MSSKIMEYMYALDRKVNELNDPRDDIEKVSKQVPELQTLVNAVIRDYSSLYPILLALMQKAEELTNSFYILSIDRATLGKKLYQWKLDEARYDWDAFMVTYLDVFKKIRHEEGVICDL